MSDTMKYDTVQQCMRRIPIYSGPKAVAQAQEAVEELYEIAYRRGMEDHQRLFSKTGVPTDGSV